MSPAIIVKGNEKVLHTRQTEADRFYTFLAQYFTERGHPAQVVSPHRLGVVEDARYLVGHSQGTAAVLDRLREGIPQKLQAIALFDPSQDYTALWNSLRIPKVAFISTICQRPYAEGFDDAVHLDDSHYFTRSFQRIQRGLDQMIRVLTVRSC